MNLNKIKKQISILKSYKTAESENPFGGNNKDGKKVDPNEAKLEGISFRYKTVQFHLLDDTFEELKREPEIFGDIKIYSERFSLPGFGEKVEELDGSEYQFEVIVFISAKVNSDNYFQALNTALEAIEKKHAVQILVTQYEKQGKEPSFNVHRITYYTKEEGIFSKE
jgi:hypothetical protein